MLHLYQMADYSSHNELIYLLISWTDVITQLQTEATPLHGLHIPQVICHFIQIYKEILRFHNKQI